MVDAAPASSGAALLAPENAFLTAGQRCVRHDSETRCLTLRYELLRLAERIRPLLHTLTLAPILNDRTHNDCGRGARRAVRDAEEPPSSLKFSWCS